MPFPIHAQKIVALHLETVQRWHDQEIDNPYRGFLAVVCHQHEQNFRLWHQEDIARSPTATNRQIAKVKRTIDKLNQARNDAIEQIDDAVTDLLCKEGPGEDPAAPLNSETLGSIIDRLSIMSLRRYHYREQAGRADTDESHRKSRGKGANPATPESNPTSSEPSLIRLLVGSPAGW